MSDARQSGLWEKDRSAPLRIPEGNRDGMTIALSSRRRRLADAAGDHGGAVQAGSASDTVDEFSPRASPRYSVSR
jgi:hypothetical protein